MRFAFTALTGRSGAGGRLLAVRGRTVLAIAVALTVAISALPVAGVASQRVLLLLVLPVALCAAAFGLAGGIVASGLGVAVASGWHVYEDQSFHLLGDVSVAAALLVVGAFVGLFADESRSLQCAITRHHDLSLDLVATADFDGFFTRVNPAFQRTLGYEPEEMLARPFLDFVHPDDRDATLAEVARQAEAGEEVIGFQNRYRHRDGSYRWLEWMSRPDADARQLIAIARDVTARKEAEEAIARHQELLERAVQERTRELERRTREVDEARLETLRRLALAAEYRDDETHRHTLRVGRASALVAEQLGLDAETVALMRQAAPLHDLGKIAVPDTILLKRGRLTPEEFDVVKRHAAVGAAILSGSASDVLRLAEEIALNHHEWWDGSGYPAGLEGDEIPLSGRIVCLADVFDALTHRRPYKEAWPVERAVAEIRRLRARQFDPAVVDAFERLEPHLLAGPVADDGGELGAAA